MFHDGFRLKMWKEFMQTEEFKTSGSTRTSWR